MYYFAYGSNMNHEQMENRCPDSVFLRRCELDNYCFVWDGYSEMREGAVANILKSKEKSVWGGLYKISQNDLIKLDNWEGYPEAYNRNKVVVKDDAGREYSAIVYYRESRKKGEPSKEYFETVKKGAFDCNLPENYIKKYLLDGKRPE